MKISWTKSARAQLKSACDYIKQDSAVNSEKVRKRILAAAMSLALHPNKHPADKHKTDNDGSYRAFVVYRYRISYLVQDSEITIMRVRHTSMEPLEY